jgi:hypothetical protein
VSAAPIGDTTRDRIRDNLAERSQEMEALCPEALDLVAERLHLLQTALRGRASLLSGTRPGKYRREQLRGIHPFTIEDECHLAVVEPAALVGELRLLARVAGYELVPAQARTTSLQEATARVSESSGDLVATVTRAAADGRVDDEEERAIDERILEAERNLAALRAAKARA